MHPAPEAASAAEWSILAMALRAVFARQCVEGTDVSELRLSVTGEALPGLAVVEYEVIDSAGYATAGGTL